MWATWWERVGGGLGETFGAEAEHKPREEAQHRDERVRGLGSGLYTRQLAVLYTWRFCTQIFFEWGWWLLPALDGA